MKTDTHHMVTKCPICSEIKDNRASQCHKCFLKTGRARRGTGKGFYMRNGYRVISLPLHPNADRDGFILEHRYIMEQHLGRYLADDEHIHHKNGIRDDNRLENLEIVTNKEHPPKHTIGQFKGWTWHIIDNRRVWLCPQW